MKTTTKFFAAALAVSTVCGFAGSSLLLPGLSVTGARAHTPPDVAAEYAVADILQVAIDLLLTFAIVVVEIVGAVGIPVMVFALIVAACIFVVERVARDPAVPGCCQQCRYQLTASQDVCPECGTTVDRAKAWPSPEADRVRVRSVRGNIWVALLFGIVIGGVAGPTAHAWISVVADARDAAAFVKEVEQAQLRGKTSLVRDAKHRDWVFNFDVYTWEWSVADGFSLESESFLDF